jgi:hypothetical protein
VSPQLNFGNVAAVLVFAALAGCNSSPIRDRAALERPPVLLSAGVLELPADCAVPPGTVYRTQYLVGEGGTVEQVASAEGPPCVQSALVRWVNTFRYAPGTTSAQSTVDWMVTVAAKQDSMSRHANQ